MVLIDIDYLCEDGERLNSESGYIKFENILKYDWKCMDKKSTHNFMDSCGQN